MVDSSCPSDRLSSDQQNITLCSEAERERLVSQMALRIRQSLELSEILQTCVTELRGLLNGDRLLIYQFQPDWSGLIVAESVAEGIKSALGNRIDDSCFERWQNLDIRGESPIIANDIEGMGYTPCHVDLLKQYGVTANLVQPIYVEETLWGLLIAHHCGGVRQWQPMEAQIFKELSVQLAIAIRQSNLVTVLNKEIAERKQLEQCLYKIQDQYDKAQNIAKIGHWELNLQTNDLSWSPEVFRIFEINPSQFAATYEGFLSMVHPGDRDDVCRAYQRHLSEQEPYSLIHRLQMSDGRIKYVREECETTFREDGTPLVSVGTMQDITTEKQQETDREEAQRLKQEFNLLETVLDVVMAGYWDWNLVDDREYLSSGFKRMFGYDDGEVASSVQGWQDLIFPEDLPGVLSCFEQHIQSRGKIPYYNEVRYRHKDGSTVWVICSGHVIEWDEDGKPLRMVGCHIDITRLKQMEISLRESEAFIQAIADASPDVLYVFDILAQRNIYVNRQSSPVLGYSPEEIQAVGDQFLSALIYPDDRNKALKHFERLQRAQPGMILENEYRIVAKDGSLRWFLSQDVVFKRNEMGQVQQVVGVAQDITQRKLAEQQLQRQAQQERILSSIIERMRASLDLAEVLNTTVETLREVLGADRVLVYRVFENGTGAAIAEAVLPEWERLLDRIFPEEVFPQQNYDRYVDGRIFALYDREAQQNQVLPCLIDFLRDIKVQAKLVVPIVQQEKLWGLLIAHQCDRPRNWQDWEIQLLRRVANQLAIAIQQTDLYQQLQLELTERQVAQEQLSASNQQLALSNQQLARATRLKDEFLANMSHELRTPLNAILGLTEGVLEGVFGPLTDKQRKSLQTVERSGRHLLSLINDILDVAKIEAGEVELDCMNVSVKSLCETSLVFIKQQAQKKNIQLIHHIPDHLPNLWGDERRLHQILINLLNNAVKFTPDGGRITLTVRRVVPTVPMEHSHLPGIERVSIYRPTPPDDPSDQAYVEIAITDTGIGIAPENLVKLFQPFVQIDSALNRQYEGTGLGLALVKQLVELHGGAISVFSRLDIGSTFTVSLPVMSTENVTLLDVVADPDPASLSQSVIAMSENSASFLILLAEDNEANATTFMSYLEAKGYRTIHALNGEMAIALIQAKSPDLVLMDIQMPVMDGLTAIAKIRTELELKDLPIIALTALAMDGDEEKCLTVGASSYLSKPVKLKELVTLIENYLHREQS